MLAGEWPVILAVGRIPIEANASNFRNVREQLRKLQPGEPLTITVLRGGRVIELQMSAFRMSGTD